MLQHIELRKSNKLCYLLKSETTRMLEPIHTNPTAFRWAKEKNVFFLHLFCFYMAVMVYGGMICLFLREEEKAYTFTIFHYGWLLLQ